MIATDISFIDNYICNVFKICHKCNMCDCLPCKMINHTGKKLDHLPETVISPTGNSNVAQDTLIFPSRAFVLHTN